MNRRNFLQLLGATTAALYVPAAEVLPTIQKLVDPLEVYLAPLSGYARILDLSILGGDHVALVDFQANKSLLLRWMINAGGIMRYCPHPGSEPVVKLDTVKMVIPKDFHATAVYQDLSSKELGCLHFNTTAIPQHYMLREEV